MSISVEMILDSENIGCIDEISSKDRAITFSYINLTNTISLAFEIDFKIYESNNTYQLFR